MSAPLNRGGRSAVSLRATLLPWYEENKRSLPFRGAPTPYAVWVSEVMLQQTRVETVKSYFKAWMVAFPDLVSLSKANEDDVLRLWQGLGYYSRARRLLSGAQVVVKDWGGELPSSPEELQKIPGIGPYTAGAISSIAYGKPSPLVDGNVIRVLTRVFGLSGDPTKAPLKTELWGLAGSLVPDSGAGDFNQALMELGALVCTPTSPICVSCPWRGSCVAQRSGQTTRFPELPPRATISPLLVAVVLLRHRGRYAVQKLATDARFWAGLSAFPYVEVRGQKSLAGEALRLARDVLGRGSMSELEELPAFRHSITRYKITLTPFLCHVSSRETGQGSYRWLTLSQLAELPLSAPHRRVHGMLEKRRARP